MTMYNDILTFWFEEIDQSKWWIKDEEFDQLIVSRFLSIYIQVAQCECFEWRKTARGRLAEIIVLDQFSRNMFRNTAKAFSADSLALALAQEAIALKTDKDLNEIERSFLYMPFMHSESVKIHEMAVGLYEGIGIKSFLDFELKHREIIRKFGRYPHRNVLLGRTSTSEEIEFLKTPGSAF